MIWISAGILYQNWFARGRMVTALSQMLRLVKHKPDKAAIPEEGIHLQKEDAKKKAESDKGVRVPRLMVAECT